MGGFYVGLDVSDETTALCVIDTDGEIVFEDSVESTPAAIVRALAPYRRTLHRLGHESGAKNVWLHKELLRKRLPVVCMDARTAHGALSTKRNKTDKNDARGLAQIVRNGWYSEAHVKSEEALRLRALLANRDAILRKAISLDLTLRGTLKLFGASIRPKTGQLVLLRRRKDSALEEIAACSRRAREAMLNEVSTLDRVMARLAQADPICRRLMTVPGVGPKTALVFRAAVDDPSRFSSSRNVAASFGLTPRRYQSGQTNRQGRISKIGDARVRTALRAAAFALLVNSKSDCDLRRWGLRLRREKDLPRAAIAVARKLAVVMHRMWITGRDFEPHPIH